MIKMRLLNLLILFGSLSCVILSGCGHSGKGGEGTDSLSSDLGVDTFTYSAVAGLEVTDSATIKENEIKYASNRPRLFSEHIDEIDTVEYDGDEWEYKHYLSEHGCKCFQMGIKSYENGKTALSLFDHYDSFIIISVKDKEMEIINFPEELNISILPSDGIRKIAESLKLGKSFKRARTNSRKVLSMPEDKWRLPMRIVYNDNGIRLVEEGGPLVLDIPYDTTVSTPEAAAILKKRMPSLLPPFVFPSLLFYFGYIYNGKDTWNGSIHD